MYRLVRDGRGFSVLRWVVMWYMMTWISLFGFAALALSSLPLEGIQEDGAQVPDECLTRLGIPEVRTYCVAVAMALRPTTKIRASH